MIRSIIAVKPPLAFIFRHRIIARYNGPVIELPDHRGVILTPVGINQQPGEIRQNSRRASQRGKPSRQWLDTDIERDVTVELIHWQPKKTIFIRNLPSGMVGKQQQTFRSVAFNNLIGFELGNSRHRSSLVWSSPCHFMPAPATQRRDFVLVGDDDPARNGDAWSCSVLNWPNRLELALRCVDMLKHIAEKGTVSRTRGLRMDLRGACRKRFASTALICCAVAGVFYAAPARADFRVCNATQNLVGVSIGYRAADGWKTEGWWQIEGAACKVLIEGPLASRFYYLYAEDAERGGRWDGPINMCVAEKEFKIAGVEDCFARGFQRAGFKEYDTGEQPSWMVQLTDEPAPGSEQPIAGSTQPADGAPQQ